jgi:hypothetical protein
VFLLIHANSISYTSVPKFLSCIERALPDEDAEAAARFAIDTNPQNAIHSTPLGLPALGDDKLRLALSIRRQWKAGETLTVAFTHTESLGNPEAIISKVKEYANIWTEYANIKFDFNPPDPATATIRVSFVPDGGHNSLVGTDAKSDKYKGEPTMNLDPKELNRYLLRTDPERFRQIVLHEFGHALGCIHEHQQPDARIQWDTDYLYKHLAKPPNEWDEEKVNFNIINHYKKDSPEEGRIDSTPYDKTSIMQYFFGPEYTKDGFSMPGGKNLSQRDKEFIATMYPYPTSLDTGIIRYARDRVRDTASRVGSAIGRLFHRVTVPFSEVRPSAGQQKGSPSILLGVNSINAAQNAALRLSCDLVEVTPGGAIIGLGGGTDDKQETQESFGCAWLKVPSENKDFQSGSITVTAKDAGSQFEYLPRHMSRKVKFDRTYSSIPKVTVWLHAIDSEANASCEFNLLATDVSTTGFTLHFYSTWRAKLRTLGATWLAHSADRVDICTGSFSTEDLPTPSGRPDAFNTATQKFEGVEFAKPPKVFMAFSQFEAESGNNRVLVSLEDITKEKMTWHINAWDNTALNVARVSFIALGEGAE